MVNEECEALLSHDDIEVVGRNRTGRRLPVEEQPFEVVEQVQKLAGVFLRYSQVSVPHGHRIFAGLEHEGNQLFGKDVIQGEFLD